MLQSVINQFFFTRHISTSNFGSHHKMEFRFSIIIIAAIMLNVISFANFVHCQISDQSSGDAAPIARAHNKQTFRDLLFSGLFLSPSMMKIHLPKPASGPFESIAEVKSIPEIASNGLVSGAEDDFAGDDDDAIDADYHPDANKSQKHVSKPSLFVPPPTSTPTPTPTSSIGMQFRKFAIANQRSIASLPKVQQTFSSDRAPKKVIFTAPQLSDFVTDFAPV